MSATPVFPSWLLFGGFHTQNTVSIYIDVVDVSQYLLSIAILVKEIHVWFSIKIKYTV